VGENKMEKDCILMGKGERKLGFGWMEKEWNGWLVLRRTNFIKIS